MSVGTRIVDAEDDSARGDVDVLGIVILDVGKMRTSIAEKRHGGRFASLKDEDE